MPRDPLLAIHARSHQEPLGRLLGAEIIQLKKGYAKVGLTATERHLDTEGWVHGGVVFALLDEAFQYACNSHGQIAVALQLAVYFLDRARAGQRLVAEVGEVNLTRKTALYQGSVWVEPEGTPLARAQAVGFRVGRPLPFLKAEE